MKTTTMKILPLVLAMIAISTLHGADDVIRLVQALKGASIIAQDGKNTFLGKIDSEFSSDSIFNEFSKYGNEFNSDSIFNEFGSFGGEFGQYSPRNPNSSKPPMIIKDGKVLGYLTANESIKNGISIPALLSLKEYL
jgi:hypothetical protein